MFDNITVKSRSNMIALTHAEGLQRCAIISISDYHEKPPIFAQNANIEGTCYVFFDDVEEGTSAMSLDDARQILSFVKEMDINGVKNLYVHCGAGVSRSAGTAAALMQLWWGNDNLIFDDGRYAPNMHCYRTILDAAGFGYNSNDIALKEAQQYELWKILHAEDLSI